jgi:hypothetical protein
MDVATALQHYLFGNGLFEVDDLLLRDNYGFGGSGNSPNNQNLDSLY